MIKNMKYCFIVGLLSWLFISSISSVFAQSSTNYKLKSYQFGSGGGFNLNSTNYSLEGLSGEVAGAQASANYQANSGLIFYQNANVPAAPTFVNDTGKQYSKLKITINKWSGDPTDATYAIAISSDSWVTKNWVNTDGTVGSTTLSSSNFQTYSAWGGASGSYIIGLTPNTSYQTKVKSTQGKYTESPLGPASSTASTVDSQIAFDIDIGGSSDPGETASPYSISVGDLNPGTATTATNRIWLDFDTNANTGGQVYIYDQNGGLASSLVNYTITSSTADLSSASEGYGFQADSTTFSQSSGGPLAKVAPYDGAGNNVGLVGSTIRQILSSSGSQIIAGRGSIQIKAKASNITPPATDYSDTLTLIAAGSF